VLTRGTLLMKSTKAVVKEDPEGYHVRGADSAPGKQATFRQKRDGGPDLWVEGQAERIEYDERPTGEAVLEGRHQAAGRRA
jgi:lipopolysaccharide export system protein LptA